MVRLASIATPILPYACGVALAATPRPFQDDGTFDHTADVSVLAGQPALGNGFARSVAGRFNADDVLDAAVVVGNPGVGAAPVQVVMNPALWGLTIDLQSDAQSLADARDVAVLRRGAVAWDALLTVGMDGLLVWRWNDEESAELPRGFVSHALDGPWSDPVLVASGPVVAGAVFSIVLVWDAGESTIRVLGVQGETPGATAPACFALPTITPHSAPFALALFDYVGSIGGPEIVWIDALGLHVRDLVGTPLLDLPRAASGGLLEPFSPGGPAGLPRRLAWIAQPTGGGEQELIVVNSLGAGSATEAPILLAGHDDVVSLSVGQRGLNEDEDLALGLADGTCWLLLGASGDGPTFQLGGFPPRDVEYAWPAEIGPPGIATAGRVLLADFDPAPAGDLMRWHEGLGTWIFEAWRWYVAEEGPGPFTPVPHRLGFEDRANPEEDPVVLHVELAAAPLRAAGADTVTMNLFEWADHDIVDGAIDVWALDPAVIGTAVQVVHPAGAPPDPPVVLEAELVPEAGQPLMGIQLVARDAEGSTVRVFACVITEDCDTYCALLSMPGVVEMVPLLGCSCTGGVPRPEYVGGLVGTPRLPPFAAPKVPQVQ